MAYSIKLEQFEGPFDLLLHLIDKQEVAVEEIFVSSITEQFLSCIEGISMDMDTASDFLTMAATLLYIKSRALLPKPPKQSPEEQEEDPQEALIRRLNEYRTYKQLCEALREHEQAALGRYFKLPEETFLGRKDIELTGVDVDALMGAFVSVLQREKPQAAQPIVREIRREEITVVQRMQFIIGRLAGRKRVSFDELFQKDATRMEYIMTFVALLELMHENTVTAVQEGHRAKIFIVRRTRKRMEV
ncbi:MAG: segregation and condensation protein A [Bacillota bacterium]